MAIYLGANELATGGGSSVVLNGISALPINSRVDITDVSDLYYANDNSVWLKTGTTISGAAASAFPQAARAAAVTTNDYYSAALLDATFDVVGYTPVAMRAKPNGTSMFILGNDSVLREYRMQNGQIQSLEDTGITFSFVPFVTAGKTPRSFCFDDPYGKKLFYMDEDGMVYQCTLGVAWDITTAVYDNVSSSLLIASQYQIQQPYDLNFNSTGTVLSVVHGPWDGEAFSLSCTTPWDLSTISYIGSGYYPMMAAGGAFCWVLGETVALTNSLPPWGLFTGTTVGTAGQLNTTQDQAFERIENYLGPNSSLDASPDGTIVYMLRGSFVYQLNIPLNTIGDPTPAGDTYIRIA